MRQTPQVLNGVPFTVLCRQEAVVGHGGVGQSEKEMSVLLSLAFGGNVS